MGERDANDLFAEFVAHRDEWAFEEWVQQHPEDEDELRALYSGWSLFEVDLKTGVEDKEAFAEFLRRLRTRAGHRHWQEPRRQYDRRAYAM